MEIYKNLSGKSGVTHYEIGDDCIDVKLKGKPSVYVYSYSKNGISHIDTMKNLAINGIGLCAWNKK